MAKVPLRHQFLAVGAILLFTGSFGACTLGVSAAGVHLYAMPACVQACHANHTEATDVAIRMGKGTHSECVCKNGLLLRSPEGSVVGAMSFFAPFVIGILAGILVLRAWSKRPLRRE